jgi:hypothetical protein
MQVDGAAHVGHARRERHRKWRSELVTKVMQATIVSRLLTHSSALTACLITQRTPWCAPAVASRSVVLAPTLDAQAGLCAAGGVAGFARRRSVPSLVAGLAVASLYAVAGNRIKTGGDKGIEMATAASILLFVRASSRCANQWLEQLAGQLCGALPRWTRAAGLDRCLGCRGRLLWCASALYQ